MPVLSTVGAASLRAFGAFRQGTAAGFISATGGTITTSGNYKYHTFTSSGTFSVTTAPSGKFVDFLVVGGGGGADTDGNDLAGGGGGAGSAASGDTAGIGYSGSPLSSSLFGAGGEGGSAEAAAPDANSGNGGSVGVGDVANSGAAGVVIIRYLYQ